MTASAGGIGLYVTVIKGVSIGYADRNASDRESCTGVVGAAFIVGVSGAVGIPKRPLQENENPDDWEFDAQLLTAGAHVGVLCGVSFHVPGLPE